MSKPPSIDDPDKIALFLDFDGTIVDLAEQPALAQISPIAVRLIVRLYKRLGGALAIVTGREIEAIDDFFGRHRLPVAGVHGLRRRDAKGTLHNVGAGTTLNNDAITELVSILTYEPGVLVELKLGAAAVHYRGAPHAEPLCRSTVRAIANRYTELEMLAGKMVFELKSKAHNKGTAIRAFLEEAPFAGRQPIFIGDDTTDEDGFRLVKQLGGISIKVGDGRSVAEYRLASPRQVAVWLRQLMLGRRQDDSEQS